MSSWTKWLVAGISAAKSWDKLPTISLTQAGLTHQFFRIQEVDAGPARDGVKYEATVFVAYDNASERYVAHWLDVYGGRFSKTLGYGRRSGDSIEFVFEYPDGPFHTTFAWKLETRTWEWHMQTKDKAGKWTEFGHMSLTRQGAN